MSKTTTKFLELAYPSGSYEKNGEHKTQWSNIGAIYKTVDEAHGVSFFAKIDSLALNPTVLLQLMKGKKDAGREVFISAFDPKLVNGQVPPAKADGDDDDLPM